MFFTAALIPSFEFIRRRFFSTFKAVHLLSVVGVALAMAHSIVFRYLAIVPLVLLFVDLAIRLTRGHGKQVGVCIFALDRLFFFAL